MNNLEQVLNELQSHHRKKGEILLNAVNDRLNKSLVNYYKSIYGSYVYLIDKSNRKVIRNLQEGDE